ncbi:MAG: PrsW family intramembrane metalloprotease [Bacteroidales bacterium]|nr:PrsW family intramembrane metalloprotease [Bacteroidales bacterium]MBK9356705.1 PrsW family intramembrane metalloprotease [Bacteroidales bacterium]
MENFTGLLLSPVTFVLFLLFLKFRFPKWDYQLLVKSFIWGCLISIPVILADIVAHYFVIDGARSIRRMITYSFIIVAFVSEVSKFFPLRFSLVPRNNFRNPADGILYSVAIALGLSTVYAVYYAFFSSKSGLDPAYFLSIGPMNALFGIIMGFFTGLGKLRKNLFIDAMTGLLATILFHGIYRFILLSKDITLFWLFALGSVFIATILIYKSRKITAELN